MPENKKHLMNFLNAETHPVLTHLADCFLPTRHNFQYGKTGQC